MTAKTDAARKACEEFRYPTPSLSRGRDGIHDLLSVEPDHATIETVADLHTALEAGLAGIGPRRTGRGLTRSDRDAGLAPDPVRRDVTADGPNRLWTTGLTMIPTGEGPRRLPALRDAFCRRGPARETAAPADTDLVPAPLEDALASREAEPGRLLHPAGQGRRSPSVKLTTRLVRAGTEAARGPVGDAYANAPAKNLWTLVKSGGLRGRAFAARAEASLALFECLDGFCDRRRIRKRLGCLGPVEFEEQHYADQRRPMERTGDPANPL